jgi:tricarballylate dehydrogenase
MSAFRRSHGRQGQRGPVDADAAELGIQTLLSSHWDVVVIGGGNAALVAAMSARHHVRRVLILERAPVEFRGGNTRHTRNLRCVHSQADGYNTGSYLYDEVWDDLCKVGTGPSNEKLAALTVAQSETVPAWMTDHGIRWQTPLTGTLQLGRTNRFFLGGGKALVNTYHNTIEEMGVPVVYEAMVEDLVVEGDRCSGLLVSRRGVRHRVNATAVVCASGGFEANLGWLEQYWGSAVDNYVIRGPKYNDGTVLKALFNHGAASAGEEKGFHAIAVDARSPRFDGGIATRLDTIPFSIVVNQSGQRFYDEGEEIWPKRYASWGGHIAKQPNQLAYSIWDSKVRECFLPPMYGPTRADSIGELARGLGLSEDAVSDTVARYNAAVAPHGTFDPSRLDDCHTSGLMPPKSHWAQPIDLPPYYGIAMRPGITFTYMGVEVAEDARVLLKDGTKFANVFAAGEIMSGNILSTGYLAGFGLTIGSVWGRIAGNEAARVVRS